MDEFPQFDSSLFSPISVGPDGSLYVASHAGKDTSAVYRYDVTQNKLASEPLVTLEGFDFQGRLIMDDTKNKLVGVRFVTDAAGTVWLDKDIDAIQKKIDKLLPATINQLSLSRHHTDPFVVVAAFSDRQPVI